MQPTSLNSRQSHYPDMSDIFISYSRKDVKVASTLAKTLEGLGYTVWWDMSGLHGGSAFDEVIQEALTVTKCAVVLWSPDSAKSKWVKAEANFADNRGVLLTSVYRETVVPMPFNTRHNEDLRGWAGDVSDDGFKRLLIAIERFCPLPSGKLPKEVVGTSKPPKESLNVKPSTEASKQTIKKTQPVSNPKSTQSAPQTRKRTETTEKPSTLFSGTNQKKSESLGISKKLLAVSTAVAIGLAAYLLYSKKPSPENANSTISGNDQALINVASTSVPSSKVYELKNKLTLLPIPAGSFKMGSDSGRDREKPVHDVTFAKPFWMSKTEITFDQYDAYVSSVKGVKKPDDEGWGRENRPVIGVSWEDTKGYVKWLSANNAQGLQCRLPSEAEWEYAARAGSTTKYPWGDTASHEQANYGKESFGGLAKGRDQWVNTAPVGSFLANEWGLHDMNGNVWEWVQDSWHKNYTGAPNNGEVWQKDGDTSRRVLRGGSWYGAPDFLRSAYRYYNAPGDRGDDLGFRIVCSSH